MTEVLMIKFDNSFLYMITATLGILFTQNVHSLQTKTILPTLNLANGFNNPTAVTVTPSGKYAYVANQADSSVSVIDIATNTVTATINGFNSPQDTAIAPNNLFAYVSNGSGNSVSVIDLLDNTITETIACSVPVGIDITPDGQSAYVTLYFGTSVNVINLTDNTTTATIAGFDLPAAIVIA